jgi:hypothetical protein
MKNFINIKVKFENVPGYEEGTYPAYFLWHPKDHIGISPKNFAPNGTMKQGSSMILAECMDAEKYGYKFYLNAELEIIHICDLD